ncbi:SAM-dependent methyltransferase [Kibdelosporangium aridum]|uniref:SAM-dependent methyltransferase n=1 Tax=Kibdelosporangium aridum TaxID=2030 RepID=UPI000561578C|nr:SAM-dependent methyltransferase [Kibdelosporangium aridum]
MAQQQDSWIPPDIDTDTPSGARTYDYLLGGSHNFAADRHAAEAAERIMPGIAQVARLNRAFLGRVVRFMIDQGIRQFLDLGSGMPTVGNVHQIADRAHPGCRVVYVDRDPIAVAHSELMLAANDHAAIVHADVQYPEDIFASSPACRLINLDEPVGVLMLALLHWIPDEADPGAVVADYRRRVPVGSYLAISHLTSDQQTDQITSAVGMFNRAKGTDQATPRPYSQVEAMFGDFELVEPGLVGCGHWRPAGTGDITDDPETNRQIYGGVGRKVHPNQ